MHITINNHFKKIAFLMKAVFVQLKQWFLELPRDKKIALIVIFISVFSLAIYFWPAEKPAEEVGVIARAVEVSVVSDLSNVYSPLSLSGVVTSVNEAVIRAEAGGRLTKVYKSLGDRVYAGQVIGEFENSSQRAVVLQAQGAFEAAKAARDIALINSATTQTTTGDAKTNALNTINSTYTTLDDLIRVKTDIAYNNIRSNYPTLKVLTTDSVLANKVVEERKNIESLLVERNTRNTTLNTESDLIAELNVEIKEAQIIKNYFDDLGSVYTKALSGNTLDQAGIESHKAIISVARATISGTIASLTASKIALTNSLATQQIAGRTTGDTSPNTAASDAQVKSAQGSYLGALANLEKTIIRSPISGTLNSLTIQTGDFVNQTTQVAVVSNNGALEVLAYVSSDDAKRVAVGSSVKINNSVKGIVTKVAGAIDPVTKKIEVRVGIVDDSVKLINGQSVQLSIENFANQNSQTKILSEQIKIPLSSVKITPRGNFVFTVSASSTLESVPVELGTLLGDEVEIISGLSIDMSIVKDARGLKVGDLVEVIQK